MNINNFNFFDDNDNDFECKSSYPLFNFDALRKSQSQEIPINLITSDKVSEIVEEILTKKVKIDNNQAIPKKRGRKPVPKDGKEWDDPTITIQEIIENDLVGVPMKSEIKMREDRLKKIQDKKAQKKAEREKGATVEIKAIENFIPAAPAFNLEPIVFTNEPILAPQIIFRDGKMVLDNAALAIREDRNQKLAIVENAKPRKLTSMSFRTRNNTAKWTPEETKKFYKGIEIFGADFSLIAKLFPTRNRDQIKNKFNKEEKTDANRINEAFKRNTILCKRSIMDRIRNFNNILNNDQVAISAPTEFDIEAGGIKALERQYSNTSTDSMDLKIMEEIQDIFMKEIRPRNTISVGFPNINMIADRPFGFSNPQDNTILTDINENIPRDAQNVNKENLLLRLI